jgi:hypothetical protein
MPAAVPDLPARAPPHPPQRATAAGVEETLMARAKREGIPLKVKAAISFMVEQKADYQAAALHAGITTHELRRSMGLPHVMRYAREQKQRALE